MNIGLPEYKRELRNGVCIFGMGEGQESEMRFENKASHSSLLSHFYD